MKKNPPNKYSLPLFARVLNHFQLILGIMLLTFFTIDRFNSAMDFMSNDITKFLVGALALTGIINAVTVIVRSWKKPSDE